MGAEIPVLTIDGPGGSGKGTISALVAQKLGWHLLDSGALYRLVALGAQKQGLALDDEAALGDYARDLDVKFELVPGSTEVRTLLAGEDVGRQIRTEACGNAASQVAALPAVREALHQRQLDFRQPPGLVADGRDMGTAIFPDAGAKIFLTASVEERAQRRYKQLKEKGISVNLADLQKEIAQRDARDSQRRVSPLRPAEDAVLLDTSEMDIETVLNEVLDICRQRFAGVLSTS